MEELTMFRFLPKTEDIRKNNGVQTLIDSKIKVKETDSNYEFYEKVINYMCFRLATTENLWFSNSLFKFSDKEYQSFKKEFPKVNIDKIDILKESILKCLTTPNFKIMEELNEFSKTVDWYPNGDNIELGDCFVICIKSMNHMYQFIHNYSQSITSKVKHPNDIKILIDKYTNDSFYQEIFNCFFEQEFKFLKEFSLFESIYDNMRENALKFLISKLRTYFKFEKLEYEFGYNVYHKNELATLQRKKEKKAEYDKKRRTGNIN